MPKSKKEDKVKKVKASGKGVKMADMSATAVVIDEAELEKQLKDAEAQFIAPAVAVGAQRAVPDSDAQHNTPTKPPKTRGKNYQTAKKMIDKNKVYSIKEAVELLKIISKNSKFEQTVELHLNVVSKGLSGEVNLPHFKGKERKIAIFNDSLATEIKAGKINFDILLATPADMPKILPLAKILGPKGLMPNPKNGTLVPDPKKATEKFSSGAVHFKTEKDFPLIHTVVGKLSQPVEELTTNFEAFIKAVNPKNISKAVIKSTMSPAIKVTF